MAKSRNYKMQYNKVFFHVNRLALAINIIRQKPSNMNGKEFTKQIQDHMFDSHLQAEKLNAALKLENLKLRQKLAMAKTDQSEYSADNRMECGSGDETEAGLDPSFAAEVAREVFELQEISSAISNHANFLAMLNRIRKDDKNNPATTHTALDTVKKIIRQLFLLCSMDSPERSSRQLITSISTQTCTAFNGRLLVLLSDPSVIEDFVDEYLEMVVTCMEMMPSLSPMYRTFLLDLTAQLGKQRRHNLGQGSSYHTVKLIIPSLVQGLLVKIVKDSQQLEASKNDDSSEEQMVDVQMSLEEQLCLISMLILRLLAPLPDLSPSLSDDSDTPNLLFNEFELHELCGCLDYCMEQQVMSEMCLHPLQRIRTQIMTEKMR